MGIYGTQPAEKFMLWIDAVGGFWVCMRDDVVLGQPGDAGTDVPILADLSSRHARIRRDGEEYLIEAMGDKGRGMDMDGLKTRPTREVRLSGRSVSGLSGLADGSRIELGPGVELAFRRPHPLSATARLDFVSRHRTQPSSDGVLLLADSCVLGPKPHSHVVCPHWPQEVIIFRYEKELFCRTPGKFEIDGVRHRDRGKLRPDSRVSGEGFSFSLEPILVE